MTKADRLGQLRGALREMLTLMNHGASFPKLSRAQGFVDGYMQAILEAQIATQAELLALVAEERARLNGPPTAGVDDADEVFTFVRASA